MVDQPEQLDVDDPFAAADAKIAEKETIKENVNNSTTSGSYSRPSAATGAAAQAAKNDILYGEKFLDEVQEARSTLTKEIQQNRETIDKISLEVKDLTGGDDTYDAVDDSKQLTAAQKEQQEKASMWTVSEPIEVKETEGLLKIGTVVKYTVTGWDDEGEFQVQRRFNEFYQLWESLVNRWPGCYVPGIPQKEFFGKGEQFIEKRRMMLERFVREIAKYNYLVNSFEFKIFTRNESGEVTQLLSKLPNQSPLQILQKYREIFHTINEDVEEQDVNEAQDKIHAFQNFLTKVQQSMIADFKAVEQIKKHYEDAYQHDLQVIHALTKFEQTAIDYYSNGDEKQQTLGQGHIEEHIKSKGEDTLYCLKNPFAEIAHWIRGEMLDMEGIKTAISSREAIHKKQQKLNDRILELQDDVQKMQKNQFSFKALFKNKQEVDASIIQCEKEIHQCTEDNNQYDVLQKFLTLLQGHMMLETFKKQKIVRYVQMLKVVSYKEIHNSALSADLANEVLGCHIDRKEPPPKMEVHNEP